MQTAAALCLPTALLAQDAVDGATALCLHFGDSEAVCTCATADLAGRVSEGDMALYDEIGVAALSAMENDMGLAEAFEAALTEVAAADNHDRSALRGINNAVGRAHRDAIETCGG
jgi:hypothetical protein